MRGLGSGILARYHYLRHPPDAGHPTAKETSRLVIWHLWSWRRELQKNGRVQAPDQAITLLLTLAHRLSRMAHESRDGPRGTGSLEHLICLRAISMAHVNSDETKTPQSHRTAHLLQAPYMRTCLWTHPSFRTHMTWTFIETTTTCRSTLSTSIGHKWGFPPRRMFHRPFDISVHSVGPPTSRRRH